jgi:hypothetical protein
MSEETKPTYKKSTIISSSSDKPKAAKSKHYVDNEAFYQALVERRKLIASLPEGEPKPQPSNFIGKCIMDIAKNLSTKYQFNNYPYREEMIGDAIEHCVRYLDSFDPEKSNNPFSYFTQTCYYQFIGRIATEKNDLYMRCKATMNSLVLSEIAEHGVDIDDQELAASVLDNVTVDTEYMQQFIHDYETNLEKKKMNKKKKDDEVSILDEFFEGEEDIADE